MSSGPPPEPDPASDPELAHVRAAMRAEWRAERRAAELEALRDHHSRRTIADVLVEAMRRGDTVTLQLGPHRRITGTVTDAGRDFAVVENAHERLAARVADRDGHPYLGPELLVEIRGRAHTGGAQPTKPSATFRSVLQRFDFDAQADPRARIEIGTTLRCQPLTGRVQALAADHLYLIDEDDTQHFAPLSTITYVARAQPRPTDARS
ncbi:MAG TPA: hypothetical protein VM324_16210 [Egibacteraceae bacterium]|nr:hypothetical protein [Egibacteraceae bacterium]